MKKIALSSVASIPAAFLALGLFAWPLAAAEDSADTDDAAVVYEAGEALGAECLMVFATVGQPFRFSLTEGVEEAQRCRRGVGAAGYKSRLPRGMRFDAREQAIEGVPSEAGFHEFVAVVTENGVARERIILIDIVDRRARGLDSFASYFLGGVR